MDNDMNKKKIVFINNNLKSGGVARSLVNLICQIGDDYEVTLILFKKTGAYLAELPANIKVIETDSLFRYLGISQKEAKAAGLLESCFRAVCVLLTKLFGFKAIVKLLLLSGKKISGYDYAVSFLHSASPKTFYGGCNEYVLKKIGAKQKVGFIHCDCVKAENGSKYNQQVYSQFDKIVTVSIGCMRRFLEVFPDFPEKIYYVRNCNNFNEILNKANDKIIKYDNQYFNILTVGRLSSEKGIERAINAIADYVLKGNSIRYHLVGDGPERGRLEELVCEKDIGEHVFFYGNQDNPYRFMKNANLFLLPSYHEAAPMVIDEAEFLGLPILATETTSTKEMIEDCNAGWVCENSDDGIMTKLKFILEHKQVLQAVRKSLADKSFDNKKALEQFKRMLEG